MAEELRARGAEVAFIGARGRIEAEQVPAAGFGIDLLKVTGLSRRNPIAAARSVLAVPPAVLAARRILRRLGADVLLGGGGYVVGPVGAAALSLRLPIVLTEADRHLGLTNRLLAPWVRAVCLAYPLEDREGERWEVTGRPVPRSVVEADRGAARERFGIAANAKALLVMGGSQGARSINLAAIEAFAPDPHRDFHVVHLAGRRDYPELRRRLDEIGPSAYTLLEYEPDLGDCLAACDLVLARAGGSIFEMMARGLPALLVPYPYAAADHQALNARWMREGGAARVLPDAELSPDRVAREVREILDRPERLTEMAAASRALSRPDAAARVANRVEIAARDGARE